MLELDHEHAAETGDAYPIMRRRSRLVFSPMSVRSPVHEHEYRIDAGDTIVVIGRGVREPDPDPTRVGGAYRDGPATRLRLTHSPQFPLHLMDPARAPR